MGTRERNQPTQKQIRMTYIPKKGIRFSYDDPENSISLLDLNRLNDSGELYCVQPGIIEEQVDYFWQLYLEELERHPPNEKQTRNQNP